MTPCFRGPVLAVVAALCAGCGLVLDLGDDERGAPRDGGTGAEAGHLDAGGSDGGADSGVSTDAGHADAAIPLAPPVALSPTAGRQAYPSILWTGDHFAVVLLASTDAVTSVPRLYRFGPGETEPFEPPLDLASEPGVYSTTTSTLHGAELAVGWVANLDGTAVMQGAMVAHRTTRPTGTAGPVAHSLGLRDVLFFSFAGELWSVLRTPGASMPGLSYVNLGPDGTTSGSVIPFFDERSGEIDVTHAGGTPILASGYSGVVASFDGTAWETMAGVRTVLAETDEPGMAPRPEGGVWSVWSQDIGTDPSLLHAVSIRPGEAPIARRLEGWQGADPVLTSHESRLVMATVQQDSATAPRHLALGELQDDGLGTTASPCVVPLAAGNLFSNDPDIACGGGWCAVVWLESADRFAEEYVVRFAQFPAGDPSHLCP